MPKVMCFVVRVSEGVFRVSYILPGSLKMSGKHIRNTKHAPETRFYNIGAILLYFAAKNLKKIL